MWISTAQQLVEGLQIWRKGSEGQHILQSPSGQRNLLRAFQYQLLIPTQCCLPPHMASSYVLHVIDPAESHMRNTTSPTPQHTYIILKYIKFIKGATLTLRYITLFNSLCCLLPCFLMWMMCTGYSFTKARHLCFIWTKVFVSMHLTCWFIPLVSSQILYLSEKFDLTASNIPNFGLKSLRSDLYLWPFQFHYFWINLVLSFSIDPKLCWVWFELIDMDRQKYPLSTTEVFGPNDNLTLENDFEAAATYNWSMMVMAPTDF